LQRSKAQEAALQQYLVELHQKSSPNYRKWLTPEDFGNLYGPSAADIGALVEWLQSQGLTVTAVPKGRTHIQFSGSVGVLQQAFNISIHSFSHDGEQFYSNNNEPSIPAPFASVVAGIAHLNTIQPKPGPRHESVGMMESKTERLQPGMSSLAAPQLTNSGDNYLYITPADAATIYNVPNSMLNANFTGGTSYTGSGVTIGIIGNAAIVMAPVLNYRSRFLGDTSGVSPTVVNVDNTTSTTNAGETYIDLELAGGLAPGANLYYYTATSLSTAASRAVDDNLASILSMSYEGCEKNEGGSWNAFWNSLWQQAAAQGMTVLVCTGDEGPANCDYHKTSPIAIHGLAVNGFASTPYNIAVGGTDLKGVLDSFSSYVNTNRTQPYYGSALSYIPEFAWNYSTTNNTSWNDNVPFSTANVYAGSGGASSCISTDSHGNCIGGYAKPFWQRGPGVPQDGRRDLPDISLMAGWGAPSGERAFNAAWAICTNSTSTTVDPGYTMPLDCTTQSNGHFYFSLNGGTSASTPAFAGIMALIQQNQGGNRLGQAAINLYDLYNSSYAGSIFHDITLGNNSVPCTAGTANCVLNSVGYYFESGYDAGPGYDFATGLGSVDVTQLLSHWNQGTPYYTLTVNSANPASGATIEVSPADTNGFTSGSTSFARNYNSGTTVTLTAQATFGGYSFSYWQGCGSSIGVTCNVTVTSNMAVTAYYVSGYSLTVVNTGTGTGTVTSSPSGIDCGATCSTGYDSGAGVTLTATPNANSTFIGWNGGGCSGTATCQVTMNSAQTVVAIFNLTNAPPAFANLPLLFFLSPGSATLPNLTGFALTVYGANFNSTSVVLWNGAVRATTYVSSTQLTAAISAQDIAADATIKVSVANLLPNPASSSAFPFTVISSTPVPAITGTSMFDVPDGNGNYALALQGADFIFGSVTQWNGTDLATTYVGPGTVVAAVSAAELAAAKPVTITVANPLATSPGFELQ
jgi:hypothetical protein